MSNKDIQDILELLEPMQQQGSLGSSAILDFLRSAQTHPDLRELMFLPAQTQGNHPLFGDLLTNPQSGSVSLQNAQHRGDPAQMVQHRFVTLDPTADGFDLTFFYGQGPNAIAEEYFVHEEDLDDDDFAEEVRQDLLDFLGQAHESLTQQALALLEQARQGETLPPFADDLLAPYLDPPSTLQEKLQELEALPDDDPRRERWTLLQPLLHHWPTLYRGQQTAPKPAPPEQVNVFDSLPEDAEEVLRLLLWEGHASLDNDGSLLQQTRDDPPSLSYVGLHILVLAEAKLRAGDLQRDLEREEPYTEDEVVAQRALSIAVTRSYLREMHDRLFEGMIRWIELGDEALTTRPRPYGQRPRLATT